jgi:hypothetical protein
MQCCQHYDRPRAVTPATGRYDLRERRVVGNDQILCCEPVAQQNICKVAERPVRVEHQ